MALALGGTVTDLKRRMPLAEFVRWKAYAHLDPYGLERQDFHAAQIVAAIANQFRGRNDRAMTVADVMPIFDPEARHAAQQARLLEQLRSAITYVNAAPASADDDG